MPPRSKEKSNKKEGVFTHIKHNTHDTDASSHNHIERHSNVKKRDNIIYIYIY